MCAADLFTDTLREFGWPQPFRRSRQPFMDNDRLRRRLAESPHRSAGTRGGIDLLRMDPVSEGTWGERPALFWAWNAPGEVVLVPGPVRFQTAAQERPLFCRSASSRGSCGRTHKGLG